MAVSLKHTTQAVGTDAGNGEIRKAQWNEEHTLSLATGKLLGRSTAGTGAAEEITPSTGLTLSGGNLAVSTVPVANGGTGASDAATARTNLGAAAAAFPTLTGQASFDDGTAAAPSITNTGDTDTGVYFPAANQVGVSTDGVARATFNSSGGTISGSYGLVVNGQNVALSGDIANLSLNSSLYGYFNITTNTSIDGVASISAYDTSFNNGRVNFQNSTVSFSTTAYFSPFGTVSAPSISLLTDTNTGIYFPAADTLAVATGGVNRFQAGPSGQLGIGGANYGTSGQVLTSGGSGAAPSWTNVDGVNIQVFTTTGTYTPTSGYKWGIAFVTGGGAAGDGTTTSSSARVGGGAGGTAIGLLNLTTLGAVIATVGAGGTGTTGTGASGGASTLSTLLGNGSSGGTGGGSAGGIINIPGSSGGPAISTTTGGYGGGSFWGGGARGTPSGLTGESAQVYGGGGSGGCRSSVGGIAGSGAAGVIMIMEFK